MSDGPINLSEERAARARNARLWTPLKALQSAIRDIETGKIDPAHVYIAFRSKPDDKGDIEYDYVTAGGTNAETAGLLARHLRIVCEE